MAPGAAEDESSSFVSKDVKGLPSAGFVKKYQQRQ
jgi:hypothetical protein